MRTSLGTPRAGALHFLPQASRAPLPSETANGRLFFPYPPPFAHASITTSTVERGRPLRSRNGGAALRAGRPALLLYGFVDGAGVAGGVAGGIGELLARGAAGGAWGRVGGGGGGGGAGGGGGGGPSVLAAAWRCLGIR